MKKNGIIIKAPREFVANYEFELLPFLDEEMRRALDSDSVSSAAVWDWQILRPTASDRDNEVVPFRAFREEGP